MVANEFANLSYFGGGFREIFWVFDLELKIPPLPLLLHTQQSWSSFVLGIDRGDIGLEPRVRDGRETDID